MICSKLATAPERARMATTIIRVLVPLCDIRVSSLPTLEAVVPAGNVAVGGLPGEKRTQP